MADDKKGMLRHVDVLGRVVIPREVRKALRINYGDLMEFCACSNQQVIIRKFHLMDEISDLANSLVRVVRLGRNCDVYILDTEKVVCKNGDKNINKPKLSANILEALQNRNEQILENLKNTNLAEGEKIRGEAIICPILSGGDLLGGVVVVSSKITDDLRSVCQELTNFFSTYFNE